MIFEPDAEKKREMLNLERSKLTFVFISHSLRAFFLGSPSHIDFVTVSEVVLSAFSGVHSFSIEHAIPITSYNLRSTVSIHCFLLLERRVIRPKDRRCSGHDRVGCCGWQMVWKISQQVLSAMSEDKCAMSRDAGVLIRKTIIISGPSEVPLYSAFNNFCLYSRSILSCCLKIHTFSCPVKPILPDF